MDPGLTMASPILVEDTPKRGRSADDIGGDQRAAKRINNIQDFNNIITVLVDPDEQQFLIHEDAICDKSKFFRAACSKRWAEGQEKLVRLPEADGEVFQAYCKWVYSGTIDAIAQADEAEEKRSKRDLLFSLYLLGDMLDDIQLRRAATHAVFVGLQMGARLSNPNALAATWSSTPPGSLFRKQLVDYTVAKVDGRNSSRSSLIIQSSSFKRWLLLLCARLQLL